MGFEAWGDLESQGLGSSLYFTFSLLSKLLEAHRANGRVKPEHPVTSLLSKESNPTRPSCTSEYRLGAGRGHVRSNHIQNSSWSRCAGTKHSLSIGLSCGFLGAPRLWSGHGPTEGCWGAVGSSGRLALTFREGFIRVSCRFSSRQDRHQVLFSGDDH